MESVDFEKLTPMVCSFPIELKSPTARRNRLARVRKVEAAVLEMGKMEKLEAVAGVAAVKSVA